MLSRQNFFLLIFFFFGAFTVCASVPKSQIYLPNVPYFLDSMDFQSLETFIFSPQSRGMFKDPYADLSLNPAFILNQDTKRIYLDFNSHNNPSMYSLSYILGLSSYYFRNNEDRRIYPSWYGSSQLEGINTSPLYNFAAILPLGKKFKIALMNRLIYDSAPYRNLYYGNWYGDRVDKDYSPKVPSDADKKEVDTNQQSAFGMQTEIILGYRLFSKVDTALRLGIYTYDREGNLNDLKMDKSPHSIYNIQLEESREISGQHFNLGFGLIYHPGKKTAIGISGEMTWGTMEEDIKVKDSNQNWREQALSPQYYHSFKFLLNNLEKYTGDGIRYKFALTFDHQFSTRLSLRTYLSYSTSVIDHSGKVTTPQNWQGEYTYNYYEYNRNKYLRKKSHINDSISKLTGEGTSTTRYLWGFVSFIYSPSDRLTFFCGLNFLDISLKQELTENDSYTLNSRTQYSLYLPRKENTYSFYNRNYIFELNNKRLSLLIPLGLRFKVLDSLHLLLGADVSFDFIRQSLSGDLTYLEKIYQFKINDNLIINDQEKNRNEIFAQTPTDEFYKVINYRFGIVYKHSSGIKLFLRSYADIFNSSRWSLGLEKSW